MFKRAKKRIIKDMIYQTQSGYSYAGYFYSSKTKNVLFPEMFISQCHIPGFIALSAAISSNSKEYEKDMIIAKSLLYNCYKISMNQKTHIPPKNISFNNEEEKIINSNSELDGDLVESLYILYLITDNPIFQYNIKYYLENGVGIYIYQLKKI